MRANGISYDTGFVRNGGSSREPFDPGVVRRELRIIRDDLHCNAVRIMGGNPERLELAATYAAELGLEVWFSPYPLELTTDELLSLFADCAERAERLRRRGAEVVLVAGAELSLMNKGLLDGETFFDRLQRLLGQPHRLPELIPEVAARVNQFLARAVAVVRERFGGKVTWAEFAHARPELAEAGRRLLYQFGVGLGFLATVRADGGPRLHPMCPLVTDSALLGFLQPSPKRQDLHRDGRYALHSFPPDDNEDAFYLSGRAVLVDDHERRQAATAQFRAERKLPAAPEDFVAQDLFEFYLERCLWTTTSGHGDWNPRHTIWRSS